MNFKRRNEKGITLVALVVTIIVLIILAGVSINALIGENGLISRAKLAKEQYTNATIDEQEKLNELEAQLAMGQKPGLPEITTNTEVGVQVKLPDKWATETGRYISTSTGLEVTSATKVATVYAVSIGGGECVPVPYGFYYVGGNLDTGVIISDNEADKYDGTTDKIAHSYRKSLQGNQFVWIPCDLNSYNFVTSYEKNTSANYGYDRIPGEISQIEKYSGFYVGRYEAGICMPTGTNNSGITTANILDGTSARDWKCSDFTTTTGRPVVQAGAIPWYHVNHSTASNVAENMYKGNSYVSSGLLTGTMWDQMIAKMGDGNTTTSGNYQNSTYTTEAGVYYSKTKNNGADGSNAWTNTSDSKSSESRWISESGMLETYARYHIYDTAGNLWEWVEQVASDSLSNVAFTLRGGSFYNDASTYPASYRVYAYASNTSTNYGFRVALYLK